ncbi:MAG: hypothetical protein IJ519_04475 [Clostridia bacterium]|nr:hypothetical protein [Clostridia bacterium]
MITGNSRIITLKGPDRVRKQPRVIFGADGAEGATNALKRLLMIFVTEATLGYCNRLSVSLHRDGSVTVRSYDHGFALSEEIVDGRPAWYYDFCELYAHSADTADYYRSQAQTHSHLYGANDGRYLRSESEATLDLVAIQYSARRTSPHRHKDRDSQVRELGAHRRR